MGWKIEKSKSNTFNNISILFLLFFILPHTNLLLFHFPSKKEERTVISEPDLVRGRGGGGVGIGLGLGLGLGKTFKVKFHKNFENKIFIITILILQFFLLHLLTVCNSSSRKRGRCFLKANPLKGFTSSSGFYRTETQSKVAGCNFSVRSV